MLISLNIDGHTYDTPGKVSNYDHYAETLTTGNNTWVVIYEEENFRGMSKRIGPNQTLDLSDVTVQTRPAEAGKHTNDFYHNLKSFILFDFEPLDTEAITYAFTAQYTNEFNQNWSADGADDQNTYQVTFDAQNGHYKVHYPILIQDPETKILQLYIHLKDLIPGGNDDEGDITFFMNPNGGFEELVTVNYQTHPTRVPNWKINVADLVLQRVTNNLIVMIDSTENNIIHKATFGVGDQFTPFINDVTNDFINTCSNMLTFALDNVNYIIGSIAAIRQDDGSLLYFPSIISHGLQRLFKAVQQVAIPRNFNNSQSVYMDRGNVAAYFQTAFDHTHGYKATFTKNQESLSFHIPDISANANILGLVSSTQIDDEMDNHLALITAFDPTGVLCAIQGSMYIKENVKNKDYTHAPNSGVITYQIDDKGQKSIIKITRKKHNLKNSLSAHIEVIDPALAQVKEKV